MNTKYKYVAVISVLLLTLTVSGWVLWQNYHNYVQINGSLKYYSMPKSLPQDKIQIEDLITQSQNKAVKLTEQIVSKAETMANTKPEDIDAEELLSMHLTQDVAKVVPRLFAVGYTEENPDVKVTVKSDTTSYSNGQVFVVLQIDTLYNGTRTEKIVQSTFDVAADQITSIRLSTMSDFKGK